MAINFTTIKNTNQETVIHFESPASTATGTITLSSLTAATQALGTAGTQRANIVRFICTGEVGSTVLVQRGVKTILVCAPENAPVLDLPSFGISDNQQDDQDIVINNFTAKQVSGYITIRKTAGWNTKVEEATYGSYDNRNQVGA